MFLVVDDGVELLKRILAVFVEDAFVGLYVHDFSRDLGKARVQASTLPFSSYAAAMIAGVGETTARSLRDFFILHPPCIASICRCV